MSLFATTSGCSPRGARQLLDLPAHGGGYGHQKGEASHYYAYGPLLFADASAEPSLRDAVEHSHKIVAPKPWHVRSFAITLWSNWAMYSNLAVGLFSMGDEVVARVHFSTGIEPATQDDPRPQTHWTEPMYSNLQSPL